MRVRNNMTVVALVAAAAMSFTRSGTRAAEAQGTQEAPSTGVPPVTLMGPPVRSTFTPLAPPVVLGEAWAKTLRAVLDGVKQLVDMERVAAEKTLPAVADAHQAPPPPVVPAWQAAWKPHKTLGEALDSARVHPSPIAIGPPTESGSYTQGEHAVLPGLTVDLPWNVP
jgi:hypothetical protein